MNLLRSYAASISDFVTHVIDDPSETNQPTAGTSDELSQSSSAETCSKVEDAPRGGLFEWLPNLKSPTSENALVYYMNSLSGFRSEAAPEPPKADVNDESEEVTIVEEIQQVSPPSVNTTVDAEPPPDMQESSVDPDVAFMDWINGLSLRTEKVWQQMKQDFTEVVHSMSVEPKDAVNRTASSVRQRLSSVAEAARKIDASQFALLPEKSANESASQSVLENSQPPEYSEPPSLSSLRTDVKSFVQGVFSTLFGSDESSNVPAKDRREARLHVLRADPATYETEPPLPPAHLNVLNYTDWRAAYFDEVTCQPLPGIPLCGARNAANEGQNVDELLQTPQPSPEDLLDQNPFMRTYLSQLVRVDDQSDDKRISDADFWSRYYYRVWLLDVTEHRRRKLAERVQSKPGSSGSLQATTDVAGAVGTQCMETLNVEASDWFDNSDVDASPNSCPAKPTDITPTPSVPDGLVEESVNEANTKTNRRGAKQRRKRGKKRSESDRDSECNYSIGAVPLKPLANKGTACENESPESMGQSTSPMLTPLGQHGRTDDNVNLAVESDEIVTSGSSSVVVLSNSEDDPEMGSFVHDTRVPTVSGGLNKPPDESDATSDDWGEVCAGDFEALPESRTSEPDIRSGGKTAGELDDWDNWS